MIRAVPGEWAVAIIHITILIQEGKNDHGVHMIYVQQ